MFSNLKGFFFYNNIVRKDLLNKLTFLTVEELPIINNIKVFFTTNQKYTQIGNTQLFSLLSVIEFVTNKKSDVTKCDIVKLDHFNRVTNLELSYFFDPFAVYELFFRSYFLWYRSLSFTSEEFEILPGMAYGTGLRKNTRTGKGFVEYIRYKEPSYFDKAKEEESTFRLTIWPDFTFCAFIPIDITINCLPLKLLFSFNTKSEIAIKFLLSGLRIFHRLKNNKN